jgi:hypothetical protein
MVPQTSRPGIRFRNEQSHQDQEGRNFQANETARDEGRANGAGLFCRLAIHCFPVYHVMSTLCLEINIAGAQADKLSWVGANHLEESIMSEHVALFSDL